MPIHFRRGTCAPPLSATNLGAIWRYQNYGTGQTNGAAPVDSWLAGGYVGAITNSIADVGSTSFRLDAVQSSTTFGIALILPTALRAGDTLWFSLRTYRPPGYDDTAPGAKLKFIRKHTAASGGANHGYVDWYLDNGGDFRFIYEGTQASYGSPWVPADEPTAGFQGFAPITGVWETWDVCTVFGITPKASAGVAESLFWKNRQLVGHVTTRETMVAADDVADEVHLSSFWNGGAPQTQSLNLGRYAVAAKIAGVRDDTQYLITDSAGRRLIGLA